MIHKDDHGPIEEDDQEPLFNLKQISSKHVCDTYNSYLAEYIVNLIIMKYNSIIIKISFNSSI